MFKRPYFSFIQQTTIYELWDNDFKEIRNGNFASLFIQQAKEENWEINSTRPIIFECCNEGIAPSDIKLCTDSLAKENIFLNLSVSFNILVTEDLPYKYTCFPGHFVGHCGFVPYTNRLSIDWENIKIEKYFIALMRRASVGRATLAKNILDKFKDRDKYLLSCATQPNPFLHDLQNLKDAISPYELPILVDGFVDSYVQQHHVDNEDFFKCFINVVVETSNQSDDDSWKEVFITEKSLKPFAYRQLPIWYAVPGTVQQVRDMGFDVFDDIVDHSYDAEYDEKIRMNKMLNELEKFVNIDLDEITNIRKKIYLRMMKNMVHLTNLYHNHATTKHNILLEIVQ